MDTLRIVIAAPLSAALAQRITEADPRFELVYRPDLVAPPRYSGDHAGEPSWEPTAQQEEDYQRLIRTAQAMLGVPRGRSSAFRTAIEDNPDLLWVHTYAAGGGAQVRAAKLREEDLARVEFTTSAGVHAAALAEFALLGVLAGLKDLPRLQAQQRARLWTDRWPVRQVAGSTVVVVGMGHVGREVAARFHELGAHVIGINRSRRDVADVEMHTIDELAAQAAKAEVIINCLPGAVGTDNLIDAEVLSALPVGAIVVSLGRGRCLDEVALVEGLQSGTIGFAALDVFAKEPLPDDSPLWDMPNVIIAPHTMALAADEGEKIVDVFIANAKALLDGRELINRVDKVLFY